MNRIDTRKTLALGDEDSLNEQPHEVVPRSDDLPGKRNQVVPARESESPSSPENHRDRPDRLGSADLDVSLRDVHHLS
jgi:hypothetical protein